MLLLSNFLLTALISIRAEDQTKAYADVATQGPAAAARGPAAATRGLARQQVEERR